MTMKKIYLLLSISIMTNYGNASSLEERVPLEKKHKVFSTHQEIFERIKLNAQQSLNKSYPHMRRIKETDYVKNNKGEIVFIYE